MLTAPDFLPSKTIEALEKSLNVLAQTLTVPVVRVSFLIQGSFKTIVTNQSQEESSQIEERFSGSHSFCEHVINTKKVLKVSNAKNSKKWKNSPEVNKGVISYFGIPLLFQNGEAFGTFCLFDSNANKFSNEPLIQQFKDLIEMHLSPFLKTQEPENNTLQDLPSLNKALENKSRKLSTLIANLPGIVYRCANDSDWTMEYINGDCFNLTGYHQEDIESSRKLSFADLIHPDDRGQVWDKVQKGIQEKAPFKLIYRIICEDKTEKWVWKQGRGIFCEDGNLVALEGFITEITEQKKNELELEKYRYQLESLVKERTKDLEKSNQQLQFSTAQLKRSNEALDEFAAIASHDLKEPLRKIFMFGEHIQTRSDQMDEKCKNYFSRMIEAAKRMAQFIDDLLKYSRLNSQSNALNKINLKEIIQDALIDLETRIIKTKAVIHIEDIPPIEADPIQMKHLFLNHLSNSLKFSIKDVAPEISIEACKTLAGVVEIKVIDNGIGFDQKDSKRIFIPFERLHGRNNYEGTGIGLAFCNKIVLRHNGDISANSSEGEGTCIHIKLPSQQPSRPSPGQESQRQENQKVIVFDPTPPNHS